MTVYLPCPCLNVTVHLMKNPTQVLVSPSTTTTSSPAPTTTTTTTSSSSSSSRIDNIFTPLLAETGWPEVLKGALSLGGVSIQHTELVFTREVKEWQISTCVNCKCDVYAVSTSNDSFVYINPALLNTPAQPNPYNRSPSPSTNNNANNNNNNTNNGEAIEKKFSPAFHVMVDAKAPSITEEGKAPTYGNEEEMALFDMLQASFTKFVDEEQHQMAQRIAAYTEQESRELERVRLRALRDRDALWSKIKSYLNERNRKIMHPTALYPSSSHSGISNSGSGGHNSGNGRTQRVKRGPKKGTTESHSKKVSSQSPSTNSPFKSSNSQQSTTPNSPSKQLQIQQQQQQQQHPRLQTPMDNMRIETSPSPSPTQRLSPLVLARPQPHQPQVQQQQQQSQQPQQTWARSTTPTQRRQISDSVVTVAAATDKNAVTAAGSGDVFRLDEDDDTDFGYDEDYDEDDVAGKEPRPLKSEKTNISDSDSNSDNNSCSNSGCRDTPMINSSSAAVRCEKPPYAMDIDDDDDDDDDDVNVEPKRDSGRGMYIGQRPCPPRPQGAADCHPSISSSLPIPIRGAATRAIGSGGGGGGGNGSGSSGGSGGAESLRSKRQYHYTQHQQQKPVVLPQQHLYTRYGIQQRNNVHNRNRGNSKKCPASFSGDGLQVLCDEEDDDRESNDVSSSFKVPLSLNKNTKAFLYI